MLKIEYYENEDKKWDGCLNYSCACINTDEYDGYTMLEQIDPRCRTYEDAKKELLWHVKKLRDELSDLLERECRNLDEKTIRKVSCVRCGKLIYEGDRAVRHKHHTGFFCGFECLAWSERIAEVCIVSEALVEEDKEASGFGWDE